MLEEKIKFILIMYGLGILLLFLILMLIERLDHDGDAKLYIGTEEQKLLMSFTSWFGITMLAAVLAAIIFARIKRFIIIIITIIRIKRAGRRLRKLLKKIEDGNNRE